MELSSREHKRLYFFDNAKGILIILVVFGHMINVLFKFRGVESEVVSAIWHCIYIFHMPCFVFISGFFSKKAVPPLKLLNGILIPYLIFNTLFYVMKLHFTMPLFPDSAMWYLFALGFWRIVLPYLDKIKHVFILSVFLCHTFKSRRIHSLFTSRDLRRLTCGYSLLYNLWRNLRSALQNLLPLRKRTFNVHRVHGITSLSRYASQ